MGNYTDPRFTESDAEIIKRKARKLVGHYGYRSSDVGDIEQDLAMHTFQQTHRHDPERGSREAFVNVVAKNEVRHLIEKRTAQKRDNRREASLDEVSEAAQLDGETTAEQIDLAIDVRNAIAQLPDELRQVALLRQQHTEREIEGLLNMTRAQVRSRLKRIAQFFREKGLAPNSDAEQPNNAPFR